MIAFQINDRVRIKDNARYSFDSVHLAFDKVNGEGTITDIDDGGDYLNERYRPALMYKVYTADGRQWDVFSADELELIEGSE